MLRKIGFKITSALFYHAKVGPLLLERFPPSVYLGLMAFVVSSFLGILAALILSPTIVLRMNI